MMIEEAQELQIHIYLYTKSLWTANIQRLRLDILAEEMDAVTLSC